jgi:hypothetical protein
VPSSRSVADCSEGLPTFHIAMADVATALTSLLSELETAGKQVGELPVDVGLVMRASRQARGTGSSGL